MQYATNRWVAAPTSPHQGTAHENPGLPSHLSDFPGPAFLASAQPADRNTCNGEVARFLKATNQKYGSNADITFRRTCESSGVSAAYAAVGHSELAPSPAARTSGGAGSQSPARSAPSYSNGPAGATRARQRRHRQTAVPLQRRRRSVRAHRPASAVQGHRTDQQPVLLRDPDHVLFGGRRCERTPRAGRSVIAAAGSRAPRRCGPGRATPSMWEHRRAHALHCVPRPILCAGQCIDMERRRLFRPLSGQ